MQCLGRIPRGREFKSDLIIGGCLVKVHFCFKRRTEKVNDNKQSSSYLT